MHISPTGDLIYLDMTDYPTAPKVRKFVPDPLFRSSSGFWQSSPSPAGNDPLIATIPCAAFEVIMQQTTGLLGYDCGNGSFHDVAGTFSIPTGTPSSGQTIYLRAWNANGLLLAVDTSSGALSLMDEQGHQTFVSGIPSSTIISFRDFYPPPRAHGSGFWAVSSSGGAYSLWAIDNAAQATTAGSYPLVPSGYTGNAGKFIGPDATLYVASWYTTASGSNDVIFSCPLNAATCTLVYDEGLAATGPNAPPFNYLHSSFLFSTP